MRRYLAAIGLTASAIAIVAFAEPRRDDEVSGGGMMGGGIDPEALEFFEMKIRPLLATHCDKCHSAKSERIRGGLRLDTRARVLEGGDSGPAIVPGDPDASLLIRAVRYEDEDFEMPPKGRLTADQIHDLEQWVKMGAPDPRDEPSTISTVATPATEVDVAKGREFWSFKKPVAHPAPSVKDEKWPSCDIDRFTLAAMEQQGVHPVKDADPAALIRRLSFDLIGLPPTPEEVSAFTKDHSAAAYERLVDRLLASEQFGERWGRHWLDVARYAESSGKEVNVLYPHAWRYRDWVIDAFNDDMPANRFLAEQIAGDLRPAKDATDRANSIIATGFFAIGPKGHNTQGVPQFVADVVDEQIDAMGQAMLGMTIACARCHDHRFDPIPTRDYYAIAGIFASTNLQYGTARTAGNRHGDELIALPAGADVPNGPVMPREVRSVLLAARERSSRIAAEEAKPSDGVSAFQKNSARQTVAVIDDLFTRFDENGNANQSNRLAMGLVDGKPIDVSVLVRGEIDQRGDVVPRGFLQVLSDESTPRITKGSGRAELAQWVASDSNPLTARVFVNRVWLHLFGAGIVATPDNFGTSGRAPSHQELLDTLAVDFMKDGWRTKGLIKKLVMSRTYQLSSTLDRANEKIDPEDVWLWRMPHKRLEGEAIRDAMLACAGTLDLEPAVGSPVGAIDGTMRGADAIGAQYLQAPSTKRSVYLPVVRGQLNETLEVFDAADASFVSGDRDETNVPAQALYMMNDNSVVAAANAMGNRLRRECDDDAERIERGFLLAFGRKPRGSEVSAARSFLRDFAKSESSRADSDNNLTVRAWTAYCQALFQSAEFRYLD